MPDDTDQLLTSWALALHDKADTTRQGYADVLRQFAAWLPDEVGLLDVTKRDCQAYFADLRAQGRAQSTMRSKWIALRSFYAWADSEDEIDANPMAAVKVAKGNARPPTIPDEDDLRRVFKVCAGREFHQRRDFAMIRVCAATGTRISELAGLRVEDVDLKLRTLMIRKGKGDRVRIARMDAETASALDRYLRSRARHRFAHLRALWLCDRGAFQRKGAMAMLPRRCDEAGVPRMHWHLLRHRFGHEGKRRGLSDEELMALGGWDSHDMMRHYGSALAVDRALAAYDDVGGVL